MGVFQDQTWLKWRRWLEAINEQVTRLHFRRVLWRGTIELIESRKVPDAHYLAFLTGLYVDAQAMAVRRLSTTGSDVISMGRLLEEIVSHPRRHHTRARPRYPRPV